MKGIKSVHVGIAIILFLFSWLIVQNLMFPQSSPPPAKEPAVTETGETEELPVLPQNELYNSASASSFSEELPPFEESTGNDSFEPKDPAASGKKAEL